MKQRVDQGPETNSGPCVADEAGLLIDDGQIRILVQDIERDIFRTDGLCIRERLSPGICRLKNRSRRNRSPPGGTIHDSILSFNSAHQPWSGEAEEYKKRPIQGLLEWQ
mgnify:CR=1 FL=1